MTSSELLVSPWLRRLGAASWRLVAGLLLVGVLFWLALLLWTITVPILIAMIVAATFAPYVLGLRNRGWSRVAAAHTVTVIALLVIGTALALVILALVPSLVDIFQRMIDGLKSADGALGSYVPVLPNGPLPEVLGTLGAAWLQDQLVAIGAVVADVAIVLVLATILTFFFLKDGDNGWLAVAGQLSSWRQDRLTEAGRDALARVGGYLRGTAILAATDALSDFRSPSVCPTGSIVWTCGSGAERRPNQSSIIAYTGSRSAIAVPSRGTAGACDRRSLGIENAATDPVATATAPTSTATCIPSTNACGLS